MKRIGDTTLNEIFTKQKNSVSSLVVARVRLYIAIAYIFKVTDSFVFDFLKN